MELGAAFEGRDDHRHPRGVNPMGGPARRRAVRLGHQGLDLGEQGAASLECHRDAGAGDDGVALGEEEPTGVGQADDATVGQVETADLVGGSVPVLHRAGHAQPGMSVALEGDDHVDEVLENARPCDRAVLGHVPDEEHRHTALFGDLDDRGRDLAHLGDPAGRALDLRTGQGLDRVDDEHMGLDRGHLAEHRREIGLCDEVEVRRHGVDALGTQPDLRGGLLPGDIEDGTPSPSRARRDIEEQGGLADAGLARDEHHPAGHEPAAQHPVQLGQAGRLHSGTGDVDLPDP